jgi:hypothetical protein
MATRFLLDTNVAIYLLKNSLPENANSFLIAALAGEQATISFITHIELLAYPTITSFEEKEIVEFIDYFTALWIDEAIVSETITIRRKTKLKLPDAIIAATAVVSNLELITANIHDFRRVEGLKIINPFTV